MIAGRLRYRLKVLRPVRVTDTFGAERTEYELYRYVRAERVKQTAKRTDEAGEHFPDHSAHFNVRAAHRVGENWRVVDETAEPCRAYIVTAVVPNVERGYNTLICEALNE